MIQCFLSPTLSRRFPSLSHCSFSLSFSTSFCTRTLVHTDTHKVHSLEKPSQQFGLGVQQMSCPIEIEKRVLYAVENAAMARLIEEGRRENYLFGQRNMRMSFHYKCTNLHLDGADYIHFFYTLFLFQPFFLPPLHLFSLSFIKRHCKCSEREKKKFRFKKITLFFIDSLFLYLVLGTPLVFNAPSVVGLLQFNGGSTVIQLS